MKIELKFLTRRSGKSAILKIQNKTYVFNVYDGFQRACIEEKQSLAAIDAIFLTNRFNVPSLMATYLTLLDSCWDACDIVSDFNVEFNNVHFFAMSPERSFRFKHKYSDEYITVELLKGTNETNFVIRFNKIRGKLYPEKIPDEIPKKLYKTMISQGYVVYKEKTYEAADYSDPEIQLNSMCLLFSEPQNIPENVDCLVCFDLSVYESMKKQVKMSIISNDKKFNNFNGIYYVDNNNSVEYEDFYNNQVELNKVDARFKLPFNFFDQYRQEYLNTGDTFKYDKTTGIQLIKQHQKIPLECKNITWKVPAICFLGTGCASPSKDRNVSSILYESERGAILFDAGEDTFSQIERLFGNHNVLKKLKVIYLSHSHADHMLGIAKLLKNINHSVVLFGAYDTPAFLSYFGFEYEEYTGPESLTNEKLSENGKNKIIFISTKSTKDKGMPYYRNTTNESLDKFIDQYEIDEYQISICACLHSRSSTSVVLNDRIENKRIAYSGDTLPSSLFAYMATGVNVMIHEATFIEGQEEQAKKTMHSLDTEAIDIFKQSKADKLFLTHFSNRNRQDKQNQIENEKVCYVGDFFVYEII